MVSREEKIRAAMYKKLKLLRSITHSHAHGKASIILDATNYIKDLQQKIERLNQEITMEETSLGPMIRVEENEKNFLIKVFTERNNCPGLLVFILEALEELGLDVLQARVSNSSNSFLFEAVASKDENKEDDQVDARVIKQAVLQAAQKTSGEVGRQE